MIRAKDVVTLEDELAACLQNASRLNLDSPSNRALARLIRTPRILDYLERLVIADRPPTRSEHSLEGTAVNGPMPMGERESSR
jgi:hypothetical protein